MKKILFAFLMALSSCTAVFAQQITRFGVVDTARVYQAYFRNSAPVRNYESKKAEFQTEINKKTDALTEYTNTKNVELESLKKNLQNSDAFYKKLYGVLEKVAENEGYSMIMSLQQANAVLWYSPSVDITEKVIAELGL